MSETAPLTVTELTQRVKGLLEEEFRTVWVVGEISNLTRARSGHVYLTLKDDNASLGAVIWRSTAERLRHEFEEGMEVLARGRLVVYPPRGQYQLDIRVLEPRGLGALQAAFEKLRRRLEAEGLFDADRKRPIPFLPQAVGVVTSRDGAAIRDILNVIDRRRPGTEVVLAPASVQGAAAAAEIVRGIELLNRRGGLDVLIVGRGGGSVEDLWAFNEEPVARAIAKSAIPVISAVGHEVDVTIADYVADLRAATPSAAAELAVPAEEEVRAGLAAARSRLGAALGRAVEVRRERVVALGQSFGLRRFADGLSERAQQLDELARRTARAASERLARLRERVADLAARAEGLSPLRVLARGYSVTRREGDQAPLRSAAEVAAGERIRTRLDRGEITSRVLEVDDA